ncbi:unnamed protein product [Cyclocybe aegerita]|uniref:Uncharacterized protein n=1 Tax=Cyclocybe aegerita TaxID=1973307 RepID=A0A8S0W3A6_CYCAE|nr:unnamed protein product [Cyclocybe aegerita]
MWDDLYEKIGEVQDTTNLPKALFPIEEIRQSKQWMKIKKNLEKTFFPVDSASPLISSLIACQKKEERNSYPPLVKVLNAILNHIQSNTTNERELGPLASSAFRVYDKEVRGTIDSISGRLKPDILWLLLDSVEDARRQRGEAAQVLMRSLFWAQIFSTGEVQERNTPLLQQNATYMRALMSMGRYYTSTFVYNHKRSTFRFCFHVPFAVYLTKEFKIDDKEHFMEVAEIMYAMCKMTRYQLGYHPFLELIDYKKQRVALPLSDRGLKWASMIQLCRRVGAVGRQTLAGRLSMIDDDDDKLASKVQNLALKDAILLQPQQDIVTFRRGFLRKDGGPVGHPKVQSSGARRSLRKPQPRALVKTVKSEPILLDFGKKLPAKQLLKLERTILPSFSSRSADAFVGNILGNRNEDVLTTWLTGFGSVDKWDGVFRRSYPSVKHVDTEIQALDAARGMHGHAEYYVSVQLDHYYQDWFKTPLHRCGDINSPDVYDAAKSGLLDLEQRTELAVYTPTVGGPLEECESPRILVRCLLDCLIGLANWFLNIETSLRGTCSDDQ